MKALVYQGVESLVYGDMPDVIPQDDEQLIKVEAVGICGSDMHAYLGHDERRPAPLILGHEAAGTIQGGKNDGMRVTVNPLVTCQVCPACKAGRENLCSKRQIISMMPRQGAFAQYIGMPMRNLVEVPAHVALGKAALAEPLAVSWHAVRLALDALHPSMERRALVIGGGRLGWPPLWRFVPWMLMTSSSLSRMRNAAHFWRTAVIKSPCTPQPNHSQ